MDITLAIKMLMEVIRQERQKIYPKQYEFALAAGINSKRYSELESGSALVLDMQLSTFLKICRTLKKSPWRIMYMAWGKWLNYEEQQRDKRRYN